DGRHEIFLASRSAIVRLDGVHRRKLRAGEPGVETPFTCWGLEFGDINRDGAAELVCAESSRLAVLDALTLQVLAEMQGPSAPIVLGNVDSDAALEIVTANGYVLDGSDVLAQNGRVQWLFPDGFGARLSTGDIDGDGIDEIVAGDNLQPARVF